MEKINVIRCRIERRLGRRVSVRACQGRKRYALHEGVLCGAYPNVFTLRVMQDGAERIYSFRYSDVLTRNVQFLPVEGD